ncbi:hypothetical protein PIB30_079671 [Stylosanthes scabra]|uniref:Uncharacterized protein n=1 Tax=Stylosanthes scabra TaxID=79078 RepID=A0ABU6XRM8_9FABA|nr:hypothetical protein [Stylosanthes scabra]
MLVTLWTKCTHRNITSRFAFSLCDCGKLPSKYNVKQAQSIEMVVEDCKRIHVSILKGFITRWRVHLKEFEMFKISNLTVIDPKMKPRLRTIPCTWYLGFSH